LEGYSFTWSHPSACKMSKLDRFLVTEGFLSVFSHCSAICLDRHFSDHRPILLHELQVDYGATPFRFYHSWLNVSRFDLMVSQTWNSLSFNYSNDMIRFKKKLQDLKKYIREWIIVHKKKQIGRRDDISLKLNAIYKQLDQGIVNDDILLSRMNLMKQLHDIQSADSRDSFQKDKIKWAVEGDENSKVFHGIINQKRANLAIKGILADGDWINAPCHVKAEFDLLEEPISSDEIRIAVWACGENKSRGQMVLLLNFSRRFWDFIGPDFFLAVKWFFDHSSFAKGCNSSFIALILKVPDPKGVNDYGLISLIGSLYKDFLDDVLSSFGFGSKWRSWILGSLSSGKASVLVNGSPTLELQFHYGLKQGDPLATYLFILIIESLHLSFARVVEAGFFKGVKISDSVTISHLFYADDAVFVGEWSNSNLSSIMNVLNCFLLVSGFKINVHKSQLLGVVVSFDIVEVAAYSLGCSIMKTPFKYLGVPVGGNMSSIKAWDDIIWKIKSRLSKWKVNTISIGGLLLDVAFQNLVSYCKKRVGNDLRTRFWEEVWIGDQNLSNLFPRIFALENDKSSRLTSFLVALWQRILLALFVDGGIWDGRPLVLMSSGFLGSRMSNWVPFLKIY
nr:hypothetical protein [Tanacetum cinerariifolium]